jgi:hypothetical protein
VSEKHVPAALTIEKHGNHEMEKLAKNLSGLVGTKVSDSNPRLTEIDGKLMQDRQKFPAPVPQNLTQKHDQITIRKGATNAGTGS